MQTTAGALSPRLPTDSDADALLAEAAAEQALLDAFYAFMYEPAVLAGASSPSKDSSSSNARATSPSRGAGSPRKHRIAGPTATSLGAASAPVATTSLNTPTSQLTREVMNALLPPKSWSDAAGKWQRMVKLTHATRSDVVQLEDALDHLLVNHQARATAICRVREKFFLQVFETILRETACECPERGLPLLRIRDELRLTIEAYQTLYHNSIAYGRKKAVQAEAGIAELEADVQRLEREREDLTAKKHALVHAERFLHEQLAEQRRKRETQQSQTRAFLQTQRLELETFARELLHKDTVWK